MMEVMVPWIFLEVMRSVRLGRVAAAGAVRQERRMLVVYGTEQLRQAVRAAARMTSEEFATLAVLLSCLAAADDLVQLGTLGIVSIGVVASAGVISVLLLSLDDTVLTAAPVDDTGSALSLSPGKGGPGRVTHLRVLQVAVGGKNLGTLTA
jgi:hypothetical protein